MSDDQTPPEVQQPPASESAPQANVSEEYVISLSRKGQYVRFPVCPDEYYFRIDPPPLGDDTQGGTEIEMRDVKFGKDGQPDLEQSKFVWVTKGQTFVEKCMAQVTDFRLKVQEEDGTVRVRRFDTTNRGDNRINREVYEALRDVPECKFRTILNGAMDFVAGQTGPARRDFEELLAAEPRLLTTS